MTAGVPGLGLGGLFALLAALYLPLLRTGSKRGSGRLFAMAIVIVAAALLAWQCVSWLYTAVSSGQPAPIGHGKTGGVAMAMQPLGQLFGVPVIVISLVLMTLLLVAGEVLFRVLGVRRTPMPAPIPRPAAVTRAEAGEPEQELAAPTPA